MTSDDNIYTLKRKYDTWLDLEHVDNRVYTDKCILYYIIQDLVEDTLYNKALHQLEMDLSIWDTIKHHTPNYNPFPSDLLLHNLPQIVMSCYSNHEKHSLFSEQSVNEISDSLLRSMIHPSKRILFEASFLQENLRMYKQLLMLYCLPGYQLINSAKDAASLGMISSIRVVIFVHN